MGRALSPSPADRFRTVEEFSSNLQLPGFLARVLPARLAKPVGMALMVGTAAVIVLAVFMTFLESCG